MAAALEYLLSFMSGIKDMIIGILFGLQILIGNHNIRKKVTLSFILNGIILALSILLFEHVVLPLILYSTKWFASILKHDLSLQQIEWLESIISYAFTGLWTLPMFIICTPINSIWFREIALETSDHLKTHKPKGNKLPKRSLTDVITDLIYGIIIEIIFSIQATFVNLIPVGGSLLSLIHFALLYSLYSFEYKWFYEGVNVKKRLLLIEQKWPYFLGFGITLSILTSTPLLSPFAGGRVALHHTIGDVILSTCIFALAFPMMILASFRTSSPQTCFYRIPIFKLSHLTCNKLFNFLKY